jgi:hypothetical protein
MTDISRRQSALERLLSSTPGGRWYVGGQPCWKEGPNGRSSMDQREAEEQRLRDVKMLRRHCKGNRRGLRLADKIESCEACNRCLSGSCMECRRATQRVFVDACERLLLGSAIPVTAVSVVFDKARIRQGTLVNPSDLFELLSRQLRKALGQSGIRQAFGGFDVSANEHAHNSFSPHLRPHAYVFVPTKPFKRGQKKFRSFFPTTDTVRRPIVAHDFDGHRKGLAYALKRDFQRRVTLPSRRLADGSVERRNTRDRPLRAHQKVEIALALDGLGLDARVFLHRLRLASADGRLRIVRSDSTNHGAQAPLRAREAARRSVPPALRRGASAKSRLAPAKPTAGTRPHA